MIYQRNGKIGLEEENQAPRAKTVNGNQPTADGGIKVDGYRQVLELLQTADQEFRISLLKRLHAQDPGLGERLFHELMATGHLPRV